MQYPDIYAISASQLFSDVQTFFARLEEALQTGKLKLLQIREKQMQKNDLAAFATSCVELCHKHNCKVLINNEDKKFALDVGADGVHLNSQQLNEEPNSVTPLLLSASCHNKKELELAFEKHDANFVVLSPVLKTLTHIDATPLKWDGFKKLVEKSTKPIYALGGLAIADIQIAKEHGACGIASMRDIWGLSANTNTNTAHN